jgi:membrane-bound metal-dependent hydrolase YbcI (DUF457 family)
MPFPVGHGLIGASLFFATQKEPSLRKDLTTMLLCAALAIIPDADFILEWGFNLKGSHRGFTHSFAFGILLGFSSALLIGARTLRAMLGVLLAAVSHAPLDALLTSPKGAGLELLWPFSKNHFRWGTVDYFYFSLNPRFDPWIDIVISFMKVTLFEIVVGGSIFLLVLFLKRGTGRLSVGR